MAGKRRMISINEPQGFEAVDKVTGFRGIATGRCEYINGCVQYELVRQELSDAGETISKWVDWQRLEFVGDGVTSIIGDLSAGGPEGTAPKRG